MTKAPIFFYIDSKLNASQKTLKTPEIVTRIWEIVEQKREPYGTCDCVRMSSEGDFCAEEEEEDGGWDRDDAVEGSSAIS